MINGTDTIAGVMIVLIVGMVLIAGEMVALIGTMDPIRGVDYCRRRR